MRIRSTGDGRPAAFTIEFGRWVFYCYPTEWSWWWRTTLGSGFTDTRFGPFILQHFPRG